MTEEQREDGRGDQTAAPEEANGEGTEPVAATEESCEDLLAKRDEEIRQVQDRMLRLAAELDNTRKRLEREKSEGICFANESLIRDLLPVIDNLERAIEHAEKDADPQSLLTGVQMTLKSFIDTLAKFGCTTFEAVGKPFDPNYHEAVMQQESEETPENTVLQAFQKGYTLKDRLIRPAMVVVSKGSKDKS